MKLIRKPSKKLEQTCLDIFGKIIEEDKDNDILSSDINNRFKAQLFLDKLFGNAVISDIGMYSYRDTWKPKDAMLILAGIVPYQLPQHFTQPESAIPEAQSIEVIIKKYLSVYMDGTDISLAQVNQYVSTLSGLSLESVIFYSSFLESITDQVVWRKGEEPKTLYWALLAHVYLEITRGAFRNWWINH